jgi:hypothetical protein
VPRLVSSSVPLVCSSSADTGDGRPLVGNELALGVCDSSSGSTASLLGAGVKLEVVLVDLARDWDDAGVTAGARAGTDAGELVEGVFEKKPSKDFCPPDEGVFFNAGVDVGAIDFLGGILAGDALTHCLQRDADQR